MFSFGLNSRKWVKKAQKTERASKKLKVLYNTWKEILTPYMETLEAFNEKYQSDSKKLEGSLVYFEMIAFEKRFSLVQNLVSWGYYYSALLELRFMLETTTLAYYLDLQLPNTDHASKIKLMQKHKGELWGARLRRRTYMKQKEFGKRVEELIERINLAIDEYMSENTIGQWTDEMLPVDPQNLLECSRLSKRVAAIIIEHFTKVYSDFKFSGSLDVLAGEEDQTEEKAEPNQKEQPSTDKPVAPKDTSQKTESEQKPSQDKEQETKVSSEERQTNAEATDSSEPAAEPKEE